MRPRTSSSEFLGKASNVIITTGGRSATALALGTVAPNTSNRTMPAAHFLIFGEDPIPVWTRARVDVLTTRRREPATAWTTARSGILVGCGSVGERRASEPDLDRSWRS